MLNIINKAVTHVRVPDHALDESYLVKETTLKFGIQGGEPTAISVVALWSDSLITNKAFRGGEIPAESYVYNKTRREVIISIAKIPPAILPYGRYFIFAISLLDEEGWSTETWFRPDDDSANAMRPYLPTLPIFEEFRPLDINGKSLVGNSDLKENYFNDKFWIKTMSNLRPTEPYAFYDNICVKIQYSDNVHTVGWSIEGEPYSDIFDFGNLPSETQLECYFEATDQIGQKNRSKNPFLTIRKTSNIIFGGDKIEINQNPIRPSSGTSGDFIVNHPLASASGTKTIKYGYWLRIGDYRKKIELEQGQSIDPNTIVKATQSFDDLYTFIDNWTNKAQESYEGGILVEAIDVFGRSSFLQIPISISYVEPPFFNDSSFILKHYYDLKEKENFLEDSLELDLNMTNENQKNWRMFNYKEGLIFALPIATAVNRSIAEYNLYISRNPISLEENSFVSLENAIFSQSPWLTIPISILTSGASDSNYYYYYHKFSQYTQNEQLYFKVQAKDNKGLTTEMLTCSDYIYGCRTVAPIFSLSDVPVTRNGDIVTLDLSKFSITDLGGSATAEGWDLDFYSKYPNFERNIEGYARKAQLKIELAPTQDFDSNTTTTILATFVPDEEKSLVNFKLLDSIATDQFSSNYSKIFMRFTLTVSYGLDSNNSDEFFNGLATISSVPQIVTYFGNVPTVSHRSHNVGINTNSMTDEDVLVIENYQNRKYIRLVGIGGELNTITINLSTGEVSGMTLSGGEW